MGHRFPDREVSDRRAVGLALGRDVLIVACAISAGIHGALVPEHLGEGAGAGAGFLVSALLLIALGVALTRTAGRRVALASAIVLGSLIVAYGFAVTTGVPLLYPDVEPVNGLALFTKAIEVVGLAAALVLLERSGQNPHLSLNERTTR